jgi:hypothetical protein
MSGFDRAELENFWQEWLDASRAAQDSGDWSALARWYAPDASYGWSCSPTDHFMATGRDEIRDWALGTEMHGYADWMYPYQASVIDERNGQIVGFWRQLSMFPDGDGVPYEVPALACSWFQYAGDRQWAWQRDIFDVVTASSVVVRVIQDGKMSPDLDQHMQSLAAGTLPGHFDSIEAMTSPLWPVPRDAG